MKTNSESHGPLCSDSLLSAPLCSKNFSKCVSTHCLYPRTPSPLQSTLINPLSPPPLTALNRVTDKLHVAIAKGHVSALGSPRLPRTLREVTTPLFFKHFSLPNDSACSLVSFSGSAHFFPLVYAPLPWPVSKVRMPRDSTSISTFSPWD